MGLQKKTSTQVHTYPITRVQNNRIQTHIQDQSFSKKSPKFTKIYPINQDHIIFNNNKKFNNNTLETNNFFCGN